MTEVLSREEIDQLLAAINAGDSEPEDKPPKGSRKIKIYDFARPDKFSRDQIRTVSIIHETFARLITTSLSAYLRAMVHCHVASVDQLTYEEFIRSIPTPTTLAIVNMDPLIGNAVMEIDPAISFSIIDRLFGGIGEGVTSQHALTDIEAFIMEGVIVRMLGNLREAWTTVIDLRPRLCKIETNPQFAQIVPPAEMVLLVTIEAKVGDVEGMINICIPYLTVEPIIGRLSNLYGGWGTVTHSKKNTLANREDIPVKLTAEILRRDYPIGEIKEWKEETILLPLCPLAPNHCYLKIGDRRVWRCRMMDDEKWFSKKIVVEGYAKMPFGTEDRRMEMDKVNPVVEKALETAKVRVSVELGSAAMSVKEVFGIGEGTFIELDKLAGEPVDVMANGVPFARGEVVVIDENFGVRITEIIAAHDPCAKQETTSGESQEQGS
jgi:flagellar motor switch protein FliM